MLTVSSVLFYGKSVSSAVSEEVFFGWVPELFLNMLNYAANS